MKNLSLNAIELLSYLQSTGGAWENNCLRAVFKAPEYKSDPENQRIFWQWECDAFGCSMERPVGNESVLFAPQVEKTYSSQLSEAYQELKKAGLAFEKNSGFNDYFFFPI